ncbi:MAG TPA: asparagine synthase-related protein [Gemmatimonadaceae bacterium]|nr:asparagine synthase-related protein [Gemmatimonadaceae bacterium]
MTTGSTILAPSESSPVIQTSPEWLASFGPRNENLLGDGSVATVVHAEGDRAELRLVTDLPGSGPESLSRLGCGLIFSGELYERDELAKSIGIRLTDRMSAAELVLESYLVRGEAIVSQIKGVFALIIWDPRRDLLLCARDRTGIYPLFYSEAGPDFVASTSVRALLRHAGVSREINRTALAERLSSRFFSKQDTALARVQRVPAGHVLRIVQGKREVREYWNPMPEGEVRWETGDIVEKFDAALGRAVARCLTQGRTGIFLSGGLDSVSIAALALDPTKLQDSQRPLALSLIFPHRADCWEEPVQRSVGHDLGLEHVFVNFREGIGDDGLVAAGARATSTLALPLLNAWTPAYEHLGSKGARLGCTTILNGAGGDEWLAVTPFLAADLIRRGDIPGLFRLWNSHRRSYSMSPITRLRRMIWTFGMRPILAGAAAGVLGRTAPGILRARKRRYIRRSTPDWVAPDLVLRQQMDRRAEKFIEDPRLGSFSFYAWEMQKPLSHQARSLEAEDAFEMGRRLGVRIGSPYWDADLIDLLYRIHPETLNRGGRTKGLVRESVARRFPQLGFGGQKKVVASDFFSKTVYSQWRQAWENLGGVPALEGMGIVDSGRLKTFANELLASGKPRGSFHLWDVLNLESWARQYI